jgi:hypothetical protein
VPWAYIVLPSFAFLIIPSLIVEEAFETRDRLSCVVKLDRDPHKLALGVHQVVHCRGCPSYLLHLDSLVVLIIFAVVVIAVSVAFTFLATSITA